MIDHARFRILRIVNNTIIPDSDDPVAIRINHGVLMINHAWF